MLALLCAGIAFPFISSEFFTRLAIESLLVGAVALSTDVLLGFAGMLSLGQAAYFALAAYTAALLYLHVTQSFWLVALAVIGFVGLSATVLGAIAIRSRGVYFALITFGFSEVLGKVASNIDFLGGSDGLIGIPLATVGVLGIVEIRLANSASFYYFVLLGVVLLYLAIRRGLGTPFGSVLCAIRDNPERVAYLGYNPFWYRLAAYVLAAEVAAFGGMMYPLLRGFVAPDLFSFVVSARAIAMALVGGIGTLIGPLLGGVLITFLDSVIASFTARHLVVFGAIFIGFVLFMPDGLVGLMRRMIGGEQRPEGTGD